MKLIQKLRNNVTEHLTIKFNDLTVKKYISNFFADLACIQFIFSIIMYYNIIIFKIWQMIGLPQNYQLPLIFFPFKMHSIVRCQLCVNITQNCKTKCGGFLSKWFLNLLLDNLDKPVGQICKFKSRQKATIIHLHPTIVYEEVLCICTLFVYSIAHYNPTTNTSASKLPSYKPLCSPDTALTNNYTENSFKSL